MRPTQPPFRCFVRLSLFASLVLLLLSVKPAAAQRQVDAVPEGLTPADWQGIRAAHDMEQAAYFKAGNCGEGDQFGYSVSVSGDTVVVGAYREDSSTTGVNSTPDESASNAGAAYVFVRSGSSWTQQAYLKASNTHMNARFGYSVSVSGNTVLVGAPWENGTEGAAYVFVRTGTLWTEQAYLKASNSQMRDEFGYSVSVSGDTVAVGAYLESSSTTGVNSTPNESALEAGAAYVFVRSGSSWTQQAYLKASDTRPSDWFGYSVSVAGDTVVVGALRRDSSSGSAPFSGAAYVFVRSDGLWSQQAILEASNPGFGEQFGHSVSVAADTLVVGAPREDSSTTGVNSTPNESAMDSGAAYVFARNGTLWTQQAYLKASNTGVNDQFGTSVSVSGDRVVVGAFIEDSSTTGVNSTPNESAENSGAAYVYLRSGTMWAQQAYLKASNTEDGDQFAISVSVAGDSLVVGAHMEDSIFGVKGVPDNLGYDSGATYVFVAPPFFSDGFESGDTSAWSMTVPASP